MVDMKPVIDPTLKKQLDFKLLITLPYYKNPLQRLL